MKLLITIFIFCFISIYGQENGTVTGKVTDKKTGEALPGVNIILQGTYYGASTDINGSFRIKNVNPGNYTMKVSFIGYKEVQYTGTKIDAGKTKQFDIKLEESVLTLNQEIVIIGDKPMLDVEETQSKRTISKEDIESAKLDNINDIITQQSGVILTDNEIHIRGGRSYENAYLLDGVSVQDPLAGTGMGLQLSANAIEDVEVITGGYNAEYGQATSGVVNVRTKEGGTKFHGSVSYKDDNLFGKSSPHVFNTDVLEANLSGPEPLTSLILPQLGVQIPGEISFFGNFFGGITDGITQGYSKTTATKVYSSIFGGTRFSPREENNWFWLGKLTYKVSPTFKISYSFNQSVSINQNSQSLQSNLEYVEPSPGYQYSFQNILDNANTYTHNNIYQTINLTHTLNPSTFYELKFNYLFSHLRADANGLNWYQYQQPKDITNFPIQYYNTTHDTIGVIPGDGLYDVGNPFTWHDHYVQEYSVKGDITSFFDEKNKFKAGFETQIQEMQVIDISQPWVGQLGLNNDIYKVFPAKGDFYAQDNINFSGMILNFGLRMDYWFPGKFVDDAVKNPNIPIPDQLRQSYAQDTYNFFGRRFKARLSPRVGISHPVSDYQTLFFSYGHFSKWPTPQDVYAKLNPISAQSSFQTFGNPDLNAETTVAYELGLKTQFSLDDVLTLTAYYKDIFDYVTSRSMLVTSSRLSNPTVNTYVNADYARSRGVELEYKKRIGKWFTGSANFAYSIITGKSSSPDEGVLVAQGSLSQSIKEYFMSWDRPFNISASTNFYVEKDEALFGVGNGILDDYNIYIRAQFESGKRYTPALFTGNYLANGRPDYETITNDIEQYDWSELVLDRSEY